MSSPFISSSSSRRRRHRSSPSFSLNFLLFPTLLFRLFSFLISFFPLLFPLSLPLSLSFYPYFLYTSFYFPTYTSLFFSSLSSLFAAFSRFSSLFPVFFFLFPAFHSVPLFRSTILHSPSLSLSVSLPLSLARARFFFIVALEHLRQFRSALVLQNHHCSALQCTRTYSSSCSAYSLLPTPQLSHFLFCLFFCPFSS